MEPPGNILKILLVAIVTATYGARILVIPSAMTSHCMKMMSIGRELLNRGHEVDLLSIIVNEKACLSVLNTHAFNKTFHVISPELDPSHKKRHQRLFKRYESALLNGISWLTYLKYHVNPMVTNLCNAVTESKSILERLEKNAYDIALVDGAPFYGCFLAIPVHLAVPFATESSIFNPVDMGMALQSNKVPVPLSSFSSEMSLTERLINTLVWFLEPVIWRFIIASHDMSQFSEKLKNVNTRELIKESVLFLQNTDYIFDYPTALFPNVIEVGGLTTSPSKQLPLEVRQILDRASGGQSILATFGTAEKDFPKHLNDNILKALEEIHLQVIMRSKQDEIKGNIHMMKWVPQNDILGHPNTKLFVSHCGKNSLWEALYHGIPILCLTTNAETRTTGVKVIKHGIGSQLDLLSASPDAIKKTIIHVLSNHTIRSNMKKMSVMFRDRPQHPSQRAASALEHVIKYGGKHMRPPRVSFISYIYFDVWLIIFILALLVLGGVRFIIRACVNRVKRKEKCE